MKKRILSLLLTICMVLSLVPSVVLSASAATYKFSSAKSQEILNTIASNYSKELRDAIADLFYDSDYSDFVSDKETLRNYESNGNKKSWPISNADNFGTSVVDRGKTINWGWGSAGCMSYACFFSKSVYGTMGTKSAVTVNASKTSEMKSFIENHVQPGEHMRTNDKPHSVVFLCTGVENGQEGFYIAEYWGGAKRVNGSYSFNADMDQYYIRFYTYDGFAAKYPGMTWFVYNAYETSDFASLTPDDNPNPTEASRDIVLVLDVSGSMYGTRLNNTKVAAKQFVEQILDAAHKTKIALVTYESYVNVVQELTDDKDLLCDAIDSLRDLGMTNMYGGLDEAGEILKAGSGDKKAIVIMTDGEPNEGNHSSSGTVTTAEGDDVYFDGYGKAIYDLAQDYIDEDYTIYSLGFGLYSGSMAFNLMKYIASFNANGERYFWTVNDTSDLEQIEFTYADIAENITTKKSIVIAIECPVEAKISYNGETLERSNTQTSFGKLTVTGADDDYHYTFVMDDHPDYDISITGLDAGTMDFRIAYLEGDGEQFREFKGVPIADTTTISTTPTDRRADFALYIDNDDDGKVDGGWRAGYDETVNIVSGEMDENIFEELYPSNDDSSDSGITACTVTFVDQRTDETVEVRNIPAGTTIGTLPAAPSHSGYTFKGWYTDENRQVTKDTIVTGTMTVYAQYNKANNGGFFGGGGGFFASSSYQITVSAAANGSITVTQSSATSGTKVTITATPNEGYVTGGVTVTDRNDKSISVTDNGDGTYAFTMPASDVTISAAFTSVAPAPTFTDVPDWCAPAVNWAVGGEITNGTGDDKFSPHDLCKHAEILTFLWRAAGKPESDAEQPCDIAGKNLAYAETALAWAAEKGMIDGGLDPAARCTRAEAVMYIWQALGRSTASGGSFSDVPADADYAQAVAWAVANGVTNGYEDGTFGPDKTCSRGEIVTFLHRAYVEEARLTAK